MLINGLVGDEVLSLLSSADGADLAAVLLDGIQQLCAMRLMFSPEPHDASTGYRSEVR